MSETSPESEGKEEFAGWLVPDSKELENITNPTLKMEVSLLARHGAFPRKLEDAYGRIENLLRNGQINDEDAAVWLDRISRRLQETVAGREGRGAAEALRESAEAMSRAAAAQERMARGEYVLDVTSLDSPEKQREFIRELLDGVEKSNRDTHDIANSYLVRGLETALDRMRPEVAREVRARLAVHDCSELIKQADGWIFRETEKVGPGYAIGSAAAESERRGHQLNREIVETFLKYKNAEGKPFLPGLDVPGAWDLLQDLNYSYRELVEQASPDVQEELHILEEIKPPPEVVKERIEKLKKYLNPEEKDNFFKDKDPVRKEALREFAIKGLMKESLIFRELAEEIREKNARKSFQLAEKLARATLEESVFDRGDTAANDQLGEIFGLKEWRARRRRDGRIRGPLVHEEEIEGFGSSWLRYSMRNGDIVDQSLKAEDTIKNIEKIADNWTYYCSVIVTRYKLLNELILDRKPKVSEMDKTFLLNAIVYFDTADRPVDKKLGSKKLRALWVAGVIDMALADKEPSIGNKSLGEALGDFTRALTKEELSPNVGTFITEATWEDLRQKLNFDSRLRRRGGERALGAFFKNAFKI